MICVDDERPMDCRRGLTELKLQLQANYRDRLLEFNVLGMLLKKSPNVHEDN